MPQFCAALLCVDNKRKVRRDFTVTLPPGSSGVDLARAAYEHAGRKGWNCLQVETFANGALLEKPEGSANVK